jgi:hypothetical protein
MPGERTSLTSIWRSTTWTGPSGNGVEAYLDRRAARDMEAWNGRNEPFDPTDI